MREFKFRVWSEDRKMFVMDGMSIDHIQKDAAESLELPIIIATEKCIWQQYTGFKDKNGKDIYEGDIIEWKSIKNFRGYVVFLDGVFWATNIPLYEVVTYAKIIGNIFENPELLK